MANLRRLFLPALAGWLAALAGCAYQPYGYVENWLIRENAVPQYFALYDVFVLHEAGFEWEVHPTRLVRLYDLVRHHVADTFGKKIRTFAPLLHDDAAVDEAKLALEFYLDNFHDEGRPFAVITYGRDAEFQEKFVDAAKRLLDYDDGFALIHFDESKEFLSDGAFVARVDRAVEEMLYARRWHREEPPEELDKAISLEDLAELTVGGLKDASGSERLDFETGTNAVIGVVHSNDLNRITGNYTVYGTNWEYRVKAPVELPKPAALPTPPEAVAPQPAEKPSEPQDPEPRPSEPLDPQPRESLQPALKPMEDALRRNGSEARPISLDDLMNWGSPEAQVEVQAPLEM